ncbi:pleckstrin homology domain-containing family A member 5 [Tachysurus ichikawai]
MVLTCLCGCDKVLQTLSVEMDLLQNDKDHAEFALNMSRIELGKRQLNEQHISQKALLQEELVTIRARMCDITQEMEGVWLDYKRMESELCVFRSHLQHICHFGLPQCFPGTVEKVIQFASHPPSFKVCCPLLVAQTKLHSSRRNFSCI